MSHRLLARLPRIAILVVLAAADGWTWQRNGATEVDEEDIARDQGSGISRRRRRRI